MSLKKKGIYIAVLNQGAVHPTISAFTSQAMLNQKYNVLVTYPCEKPISYNRNKIVHDFLQRKEKFDYLMMIDDDILPPQDMDLIELADYDKDIITPLMFIYQQDSVVPLIGVKSQEGMYNIMGASGKEGLIEVDGVGTGCIIIKREVLEHPHLRAPFLNEYDKDGFKKFGLDFAFSRRAKEAGFKCWVHLDYVCGHRVKVDLKEIYKALSQRELIIERLYAENKKLKQLKEGK